MKSLLLVRYFFILSIGFLAVSCHKEDLQSSLHKGSEVKMGNGVARSYIEMSNAGIPQSIGIEMSAACLDSLGHVHATFVLPLDTAFTNRTPFDHIVVDWNPHGHTPDGVYNYPHFDFHFYTISTAQRLAIPAFEVDSSKFCSFPAKAFLPRGYVPAGCDPQMGRHWADTASSEFMGQKFTRTFIYGSYDSSVIFYEPMVSLEYLASGPSLLAIDYPQPEKFKWSNTFYPSAYSCGKDQSTGKYYVSLSKFILR